MLEVAPTATKKTGEIVVAFRGSKTWEDWKNNGQNLRGRSPYYDAAQRVGVSVATGYGKNVSFVGHSLGGGLAVAAAYGAASVNGGKGEAKVFNSAGVNNVYVGDLSSGGLDIVNSVSAGRNTPRPPDKVRAVDPLTVSGFGLRSNLGVRNLVQIPRGGPLHNHSIGPLRRALYGVR